MKNAVTELKIALTAGLWGIIATFLANLSLPGVYFCVNQGKGGMEDMMGALAVGMAFVFPIGAFCGFFVSAFTATVGPKSGAVGITGAICFALILSSILSLFAMSREEYLKTMVEFGAPSFVGIICCEAVGWSVGLRGNKAETTSKTPK